MSIGFSRGIRIRAGGLEGWHLLAVGVMFLFVGVLVPFFSCYAPQSCPASGCGDLAYQSCQDGAGVGTYFLAAGCVVLVILLLLLALAYLIPPGSSRT
jgi:hypothetical protein